MRLEYDEAADALYIAFHSDAEAEVSRTEQIDEGTLVDLDRFGVGVGIEVLHPARQWPLDRIIERFGMAERDAELLRLLWPSGGRFPFAEPVPVLA